MHLPDRYAIIPVFPSTNTDEAIVIGDMRQVMEYIPQSVARNDAMAELERARFTADQIKGIQEKTRAVQVSMLADSVTHLSSRMDALVARRAERARRDAEREAQEEAKHIQAELDALPDPDDPEPLIHHSTGDLHPLPPASEGPEPLLEVEDQAEFPEPGAPEPAIPQPTAVTFDGE
jgi:hypothetical protein